MYYFIVQISYNIKIVFRILFYESETHLSAFGALSHLVYGSTNLFSDFQIFFYCSLSNSDRFGRDLCCIIFSEMANSTKEISELFCLLQPQNKVNCPVDGRCFKFQAKEFSVSLIAMILQVPFLKGFVLLLQESFS